MNVQLPRETIDGIASRCLLQDEAKRSEQSPRRGLAWSGCSNTRIVPRLVATAQSSRHHGSNVVHQDVACRAPSLAKLSFDASSCEDGIQNGTTSRPGSALAEPQIVIEPLAPKHLGISHLGRFSLQILRSTREYALGTATYSSDSRRAAAVTVCENLDPECQVEKCMES
ncbi:hypothetical protein PHSY_004727 [Pseudozyma hubeiensis SY62]|uniref:Uncharacterized protein n=1 Tax=Pseudozyma hubeiensis (strain SY62) TaxID=1305764 RepID=R9P7B3_PSEHS|nr:hypothetical protein PHSY_004727 [Pseudozyma hubeiensis SY62]GAC97142.1 hypothetical protein PHSY_004727 [Pseudozyma hubeiensis SY62]